MRIGILTLPQETNYGGILQAFAMQHMLRKLGHEAVTIDRHNLRGYPSFGIHLVSYLSRVIRHVFLKQNVTTLWRPYINDKEYSILSQNTQRFIDKNIKKTRWVLSDHLAEIEEDYQFDGYVVGSDQVWLDYYCPESFLSFVKRPNVKRVTYAASCGKKSFFNFDEKVKECRELAKLFDGISVRESSLLPLCKEQLGVKTVHVLDPTFLLYPEEYISVVESAKDNSKIIFSYILDESDFKKTVLNAVAEKYGLAVVSGNASEYFDRTKGNDIYNCIFPSVDDWINNLNRAEFVVTDSFHGTVFSILFNKPFVTIANKERGLERFLSLLSMFGLESRLLVNENADINKLLNESINYIQVNEKLSLLREKSMEFLTNSLKW